MLHGFEAEHGCRYVGILLSSPKKINEKIVINSIASDANITVHWNSLLRTCLCGDRKVVGGFNGFATPSGFIGSRLNVVSAGSGDKIDFSCNEIGMLPDDFLSHSHCQWMRIGTFFLMS